MQGMQPGIVYERSRAQVQADIDRANPALRQARRWQRNTLEHSKPASQESHTPHAFDGLQLE
ncbi:MAG: hypothetical protein Q8L71_04900 [Thiobacillus sp.]|nr:hypothetical protein [Thiobacillus sp.]